MTITVHFVRSGVIATIRPSTIATQRASLMRRPRSQRPTRVPPASIIGCEYAMKSTVPRWCREPRAPEGGDSFLRVARLSAVQEQAVHDRARTGDVGAERSEFAQLIGEWRRREIVRRECCEVARTAHRVEERQQCLTTFREAVLPSTRVEHVVHVPGRTLLGASWTHEQDPVVLRQLDRAELAAVAGSELRPILEEERNVCSQLARVCT